MAQTRAANPGGNNFGALRLALAYLVILAHSPEILDGNTSRELLTRAFGTLSFGELAVDGFFIISGYLITSSYQHSTSPASFMAKRVLRIYPGFVVAFLLCVYLLAPWVGGAPGSYRLGLAPDSLFGSLLLLRSPQVPGVFAGAHYPHLNGATWTIKWEFLAYLFVLAVGLLGLLKKRGVIAAVALLALALNAALQGGLLPPPLESSVSRLAAPIRFLGLFASGAVFYLFRDRIVYRPRYAAVALLAGLGLMCFHLTAEAAVATLGGYLLFFMALHVRSERLARVGVKNDYSYGVYLYAWPIQATIVWLQPGISPWLLFALTCLGVVPFAMLSWFAVEQPATRLRERVGARRDKLLPGDV